MAHQWPVLKAGAIVALTGVILICVGQRVWPQSISGIDTGITDMLRLLSGLGWLGFLLVQVMVTISGFLPASLVAVSAGAAYGVALGFASASISTLTGAAVAFLLSRSLLRPFIERKILGRPRLSGLDGQIKSQGWRLVCLLRLSPVMPFAATSYALGLSSIALGEYLIGTLASLPPLLAYVLTGAFVKTGVSAWSHGEHSIRLVLVGTGTLAMVVLAIQAARMLRRIVMAPNATPPSPSGIRTTIVRGTRFVLLGVPKPRTVERSDAAVHFAMRPDRQG
jgi:uncharacterized membrane protein YdjX (TVP38/TMEM64 family)